MSASRTSSFMNETINSLFERWFTSSHVVLEIWLSSCHAPLSDKARDEISTLWPPNESVASLLAQTGEGRGTVTQCKTSERYLVETKKNGVFSLLKSRRVQTSDQTIGKMTMPATLYLPSPSREEKCGWWSQPDYTKHVFMPAWVTPSERKEVKYTEQRPKWLQTNVRRIAGGAEEWSGCAPSPNHASRSCLWHNIRWLHQAAQTVAGFDSWTTFSQGAGSQRSSLKQQPKWSDSSLPKSINRTDGVWSQYLAAGKIVISSIKLHKCQKRKKHKQTVLQCHCTQEAGFQEAFVQSANCKKLNHYFLWE